MFNANEIRNNPNYVLHHTALTCGYQSVKADDEVQTYYGKFGSGYIIHHASKRTHSTQMHGIEYWVRAEDIKER